jgi:hypothetical protein
MGSLPDSDHRISRIPGKVQQQRSLNAKLKLTSRVTIHSNLHYGTSSPHPECSLATTPGSRSTPLPFPFVSATFLALISFLVTPSAFVSLFSFRNQQDSSKAPAKPERESETVSQLVDLLRRCGNAVAVKYLQSCFSVGKCSLVTVEFIGVIKCCLRGRAFEGHEAVDTHAGVETFEARE